MADVYFRGSRRGAVDAITDVTNALIGKGNARLAKGVQTAVGVQVLSDVTEAYVVKARGGVGEDGIRWPRLSPKTLAYGRRAPRGKGYAPGGKDGLLTKKQLARWRQIYGRTLARLAASEDLTAAKGRAAAIAWAQVKREGGKTKIGVYASRPHEVLRDTGVLLNSLSPALPVGAEQVFDTSPGSVVVGTSVAYASVHHRGNKAKGIPRRPLWPDTSPRIWLERWSRVAREALAVAIRMNIENNSR